MKAILVVGFVFFVAVFFGAYAYNVNYAPIKLEPPYPYSAPGELVSEAYTILFVFVASFLFFGFSAPIALGVEAAKYASLFSTGDVPLSHLLFALPAFFVAVSATYLGQSLLKDYHGESLLHAYVQKSVFYLGVAFALWLAVYFGRGFIAV